MKRSHEAARRAKNVAIILLVVAFVAVSGIFGGIANTWERERTSLLEVVYKNRAILAGTQADLESTTEELSRAQAEAGKVPVLTADLEGTREELSRAQAEAAKVPALTADLEGTREELSRAQAEAAKVPALTADLEGTREELSRVRAEATRMPVPTVQSSKVPTIVSQTAKPDQDGENQVSDSPGR